MTHNELRVDTDTIRRDAVTWDLIQDVFSNIFGGPNDATGPLFKAVYEISESMMDSILLNKTSWWSDWTGVTGEIFDFAAGGFSVVYGGGFTERACFSPGVSGVLRKIAEVYDITEDDATVSIKAIHNQMIEEFDAGGG